MKRRPKVLILYNQPVLPPGHPDFDSDHQVLVTVAAVAAHLAETAFEVSRLGVGRDPRSLLAGLAESEPDVVFNLFEGTADQGQTEAYVAGLLEWLKVPFTGCPSQTLGLARSKHLVKRLFLGADLPTAAFFLVDDLPVPACALRWPVIVKPALQDASVGLDQGSVVTDQARLVERVERLLHLYGPPVLVEEFIRGRELNVGIVEAPVLRALPISEVLFVDRDPAFWPIVTYDAKWRPDSRDFKSTPARYPAEVDPELARRLEALAFRAFRLLGCRDYARVDFRVQPDGTPFLLELNPNPDYSPDAGLAGGLRSAGVSHAQFTIHLLEAALTRKLPAPITPGVQIEFAE